MSLHKNGSQRARLCVSWGIDALLNTVCRSKITIISTSNEMQAGRSHLRSRPAIPGNASAHSQCRPRIFRWISFRPPQLRIADVMRCLPDEPIATKTLNYKKNCTAPSISSKQFLETTQTEMCRLPHGRRVKSTARNKKCDFCKTQKSKFWMSGFNQCHQQIPNSHFLFPRRHITRKWPATINDGSFPINQNSDTEKESKKSLKVSQCGWLVAHYGTA